MIFQEYNPVTGEIIFTRINSPAIADYMRREFNACLIAGEGSNETHYVDITKSPPVIAQKQAQNTTQNAAQISADGVDTLKLDNLPRPCNVSIGNKTYTVDDGYLEWGTLLKGTYPIWVRAVPYITWRGEVTAT